MHARIAQAKGCARLVILSIFCLLPVSPARPALLGDVNGDGRVTVQDAIRILWVSQSRFRSYGRDRILGDIWPPSDEWKKYGLKWTLGDNAVTEEDAAQALRMATGLIPLKDVGPIFYDIAGYGRTGYDEDYSPQDGDARQTALFGPWDLAVGPDEKAYFTETPGHRVRILHNGQVVSFAGNLEKGFRDGKGTEARFDNPGAICMAPDGSVIVADAYNHAIRRITPDGTVTTVAGNGMPGFRDAKGAAAYFREPQGVATDPAGNIYVGDTLNHRIRKITPDGEVTTIVGDGRPGLLDGPADVARLRSPAGVFYDLRDGSLYIADSANFAIRRLSPDGVLTTVAGNGRPGLTDGYGAEARFRTVWSVDIAPCGTLWVADWGNESVRRIHPDGRVETVGGRTPIGYFEGPAERAKFWGLMSVRASPNGTIYVLDTDNHRIKVWVP